MYHRLFAVCVSLIVLLTACKPQAPTFVPVTGDKMVSAPAQVEQARSQVLKYVVSSARLTNLPQDADWQMEVSPRSEKEFHFRSGSWLIMIWEADAESGNERVIILNQLEKDGWTGYVTADGRVVDTHYVR